MYVTQSDATGIVAIRNRKALHIYLKSADPFHSRKHGLSDGAGRMRHIHTVYPVSVLNIPCPVHLLFRKRADGHTVYTVPRS